MRPLYLAILTVVVVVIVVGIVIVNSPRSSERSVAAAMRNLKEGKEFLAENKTKKGVVELPSGLQYLVLKEGKGRTPHLDEVVEVHYRGTFINGKVFDSSLDRDRPFVTPLNRVIRGWTQALQLMNEGSKWRIFVPPDLAYGTSGNGSIAPNETLIFEIELLKIR